MKSLMRASPSDAAAGWSDQAQEAVAAARDMAQAGLVVGTVGNVSARLQDGFVITPTRVDYARLRATDLVVLGHGVREPPPGSSASRETPLHSAIYCARPEVGAIVHTHSPYATAWSFLGVALAPPIEEIEYYAIGAIRTSRPAPAGSLALGGNAVEALDGSKAVLLGRHGVVAVGPTPDEALTVARVVELQAHVAWLLRGRTA